MDGSKSMLLAGLALAAVLVPVSASQAAPFALVKMVLDGGPNDGASSVTAKPGDTVNYRIMITIAPVGATNTSVVKVGTIVYGPSKPITITTLNPADGRDGVFTCRFSLRDVGGIPVSFTPVVLTNGFQNGAGVSGGTAVTNGLDYLSASRSPGSYVGVGGWVTLATGSFTVGDGSGTSTLGLGGGRAAVQGLGWGDSAGNVGTIRINNGMGIVTKSSNADPFYSFAPLTLTPEPGTMILLALGGAGALLRRRRK